MAILWKYFICALVLNWATVQADVGGIFNYFVPGLIDGTNTPPDTPSNLNEDNDAKYNVNPNKWSNYYNNLMAEISENPLSLPKGYIDVSIRRINETSLYFRHLCLLHYDDLMKSPESEKSENENMLEVWNLRAIRALQISVLSFQKTLIERCKTSSDNLNDKYMSYIEYIFATNNVDFLIFMNEQKTDEDLAEIKEFPRYGQSELDAAAKYLVITYRNLWASGDREL